MKGCAFRNLQRQILKTDDNHQNILKEKFNLFPLAITSSQADNQW